MSELEIKFQVPAAERAALLKAIGTRGLDRASLRARYFDTADHLLARHEIALRLRDENGQWVQTLKAATPHALERLEHNVDVSAGDDGELPSLRPERHAGSEAGDRLDKILKDDGEPVLVEIYRTEIARTSKLIKSHDAELEWSLDEGTIVAGERVRDVLELELEFKAGDERGLFGAAQEWQSRHGLWLDPISKAHRGSLLVEGEAFAPAVKARPPELADGMDGEQLLRRMVMACLLQILPNAAEVLGGSEEPEHVHQLRVGLRRLRTAARGMKPFAAGLGTGWEAAAKHAFNALGEARDRHVQRTELAPRLERAGAPLVELSDGRDDAELQAAARDAVSAPAFQSALLQLLAFAHGGEAESPPRDEAKAADDGQTPQEAGTSADGQPEAGAAGEGGDENGEEAGDGKRSDDAAHAHIRQRLDRLRRQVIRDADDFESLPHDRQHEVRKRLKQLRYLAQFVAPLYKPRRVEVWLKALEPAQDALGRHIDTLVAAGRFEAAAASDPRAWFAVGWLRGQLDDSARDSRKCLERFARAAVFW
jgi:inorganic triphosphatase YgiF